MESIASINAVKNQFLSTFHPVILWVVIHLIVHKDVCVYTVCACVCVWCVCGVVCGCGCVFVLLLHLFIKLVLFCMFQFECLKGLVIIYYYSTTGKKRKPCYIFLVLFVSAVNSCKSVTLPH